ncbi:MAG: hypothetical protein OES69_16795 [Myxococcales bacterium]|nr:hypothetical protein [Myxococcales bacterium]
MAGHQRTRVSGQTATALTFLGVALMAVAIGYSIHTLNLVRNEVAEKKDKREELKSQIELLRTEIEHIRSGPLAELITPQAIAIRRDDLSGAGDRPRFNFLIWLDLPYARKADIKEVRYEFLDPSFLEKKRVSSEPSSGFAVGYLGWGAMTRVPITVVPKEGEEFIIDFPMHESMQVVNR